MITEPVARVVAEALSRRYPAYEVRVIRWGDDVRYEAVARDLSLPIACLITDDPAELLAVLRQAALTG